ncbi:MAG: PaaI family thioesterase [Cellvibrionaceae bacterium]
MTSNVQSIWFNEPTVNGLNAYADNTAMGHVGIEIVEVGNDYIKGRMEVNGNTCQPAGVLHGGMSVVFAETLASLAAAYVVDNSQFHCVGQEINANHVRAVASGFVYAMAKPLHIGRSSHVWEVTVRNEDEKLVAISRMTAAVLEIPSQYKKNN